MRPLLSPPAFVRRRLNSLFLQRARTAALRPWLRLTGRWRPLPDFLVIGAQKCATTALFRWLGGHPDVRPALVKEVHFFDRRWEKGLGWYRSNFPLLSAARGGPGTVPAARAGEATPAYVFHPLVPRRVRETLPEIRLVAVLRNPVDRAYSHYQHARMDGREPLSFEAALEREDDRLRGERERLVREPGYLGRAFFRYSYAARGRYAEQLEAWLDLFPRERLLLLECAEMEAAAQATYERVLRFLGLRPRRLRGRRRHHARRYPPMDPGTRARLVERFRPHNERLYDLLGRRLQWDR